MRSWYDAAAGSLKPASLSYRILLAHYFGLLVPPDASVLEIGCGSGELLSRLRARRKVGVDVSEGQILKAREKTPDAEFHVQALRVVDQCSHLVSRQCCRFR